MDLSDLGEGVPNNLTHQNAVSLSLPSEQNDEPDYKILQKKTVIENAAVYTKNWGILKFLVSC